MANSNNSGSNNIVVPEAKQALNQMKAEIANELGLTNYEQVDKGNLTARQNGYVGGYMTKRLVEMAQRQMSGGMGSTGSTMTSGTNGTKTF
ncbi:MAG: small acid-soluble spore protein alpha/beta type [Bacillota bacterium]|jgi:hypothetical protein|nr:small acid-soluble spore protein alpha/beta type [Bacillota bacterium]